MTPRSTPSRSATGCAGRGQSKQAIDRLWNLIALPTINVVAAEASLGLAVKVFRVGLLDRSDAGDIGWSRVPLGELHGDHRRTALQAAGVETVLGSPVGPIRRSSLGSFVLSAGATERRRRRGDPRHAAARLGEHRGAARRGRRRTGGGAARDLAHRQCPPRLGPEGDRSAFAACVGSPVQFVFDRTVSSGVRSGQCLAISLSAADDYIATGSTELVATFFQALGELFPAARQARLVDALVTREKAATFRAVPGTKAFRPQTSTGVPGVFLAGASCDTGWPATMEGAVRSGSQAAIQALAFLSKAGAGDPRQLEGAGT